MFDATQLSGELPASKIHQPASAMAAGHAEDGSCSSQHTTDDEGVAGADEKPARAEER